MAQFNQYDGHPPRDHFSASPPLQSQRDVASFSKLYPARNPNPAGNEAHGMSSQMVSPIMSRTPSNASDRFSTVSAVTAQLPSTPQNVRPAPAFVAPFGATQVVSEHQAANKRSDSDDEDAKPTKNDVQFSEGALFLVNAFLDQLLFSFLSTARSTTLTALRPAVTEVLKHRLARDAIASAEEELHELLAGGEEEEENDLKQNAAENIRKWDLELVWKRTRLRVMVYMRLGEMEDDDEERYVRDEDLFQGNERRFSQSTGLVSWAAAIFLTSVLEYIAEQTLKVAGQAAYARVRRQSRNHRITPAEAQAPVTVEEYDVEKVALNSTLGRLWRTWRKSLRNSGPPSTPTHRMASFNRLSNDNMHSAMSTRRNSVGTGADGSVDGDGRLMHLDDVPEFDHPEHVLAANIPLPMGEAKRDVDEIEVPGMASDPDAVGEEMETPLARRNSFTSQAAYRMTGGLPTPDSSSPVLRSVPFSRPAFARQRSMSVPTPARTPLPAKEKHFMPGSYPEQSKDVDAPQQQGEQAAQQQSGETDEAHEPDQKFNAREMAPHKRASMDAKALLDKLADGAPVEETDEQKEKSEHHGLMGGAMIGASAVAAAAGALYGSRSWRTHGVEEGQTDEQVEGQQTPDGRDVEELDKRKSMMDMKALIAPTAPADGDESHEIMTSRKVSVTQPETPPTLVRTESDESKHSYTLGDKEQQEIAQPSPAQRQHMSRAESGAAVGTAIGAAIGVATTSQGVTETQDFADGQARDATQRPARLVLGGTPPGAMDSPTLKSDSPKTPQEFLASRSLAAPSKSVQPESDTSKPLPAKQPLKRRSVPGIALTSNAAQSPTVEKATHRQSWSAAIEKQHQQQENGTRPVSTPAVPSIPIQASQTDLYSQSAQPKTSTAEPQVHEHPVVQRMASLKRNSNKSEADAERAATLTSASIKGPQDFDSFVQGADTVKYTLTPEAVRGEPAVSLCNVFVFLRFFAHTSSRRNRNQDPHPRSSFRARLPTSDSQSPMLPKLSTRERAAVQFRNKLHRPGQTNRQRLALRAIGKTGGQSAGLRPATSARIDEADSWLVKRAL